jgi:hypothetical protein
VTFAASSCSSCGASIIWAETAKGKRMPVDARPSEGGNILLEQRPGLAPLVDVRSGVVEGGRFSHFATCPQASKHRRPKS